jgi:hypothetical protein
VDGESGGGSAVDEDLAQAFAIGVCGGYMSYEPVTKEGVVGSITSAVVVLVGHEDMARSILFLKASDRSDADDEANPKRAQSPDIGTVINFGRKKAMTTGVAREKDDFASSKGAPHEGIGGRAVRSLDGEFLQVSKTFELIEAAAADYADHKGRVGVIELGGVSKSPLLAAIRASSNLGRSQ